MSQLSAGQIGPGWRLLAVALMVVMAGCSEEAPEESAAAEESVAVEPAEAPARTGGPFEIELNEATDTGTGIHVARGFRATVVAEGLGGLRHIAVRDNGDIYVAQGRGDRPPSGTLALRDTDGDHIVDVIEKFADFPGTGIAISDGYLYRTTDTEIYRWKLDDDALVPTGERETVAEGFIKERQHAAKSITLDGQGHVYVNVGAPANACQQEMRSKESPGMSPCPLLERYGGIWRFDANKLDQTQSGDGLRFASGFRNSVALAWNPAAGALYLVQHGRDQLSALWPELYDDAQSAELPAEELVLVEEGGTYGWPYTYYDHIRGERMVGPEYGGDGKTPAEPGKYPDPVMAFPGHWAPNGLLFYTGDMFPEAFRGGAFIAFHGSWNRAPLPQDGYKVVFVPFDGKTPSGSYHVFADGFAGRDPIMNPRNAEHRPMGLAQGPDGALYVGDSVKGTIWRIDYIGG